MKPYSLFLVAALFVIGNLSSCSEEELPEDARSTLHHLKEQVEQHKVLVEDHLQEKRATDNEQRIELLEERLLQREAQLHDARERLNAVERNLSRVNSPEMERSATEFSLTNSDGAIKARFLLDSTGKPVIELAGDDGTKRNLDLLAAVDFLQLYQDLRNDPTFSSLLAGTGKKTVPALASARFGDGIRKGEAQNSFIVKKSVLETELFAAPEELMTGFRIVPYYQEGEYRGYKLFGIRTHSILKALGIMSGDVIQAVNGTPLGDPEHALTLYQKLKDADKFGITILRRGKELKLTYVVE
jgi:hypothetical protein